MMESTKIASYKAMKLRFYIPNQTKLQYPQGRGGEDFTFTSKRTIYKKILKKKAKRMAKLEQQNPIRNRLLACIEASKCRTLDQFSNPNFERGFEEQNHV